MTKNNKLSEDFLKDLWDRITACKDENELYEIWDLIDELASTNRITASQYMFLEDRWDSVLSIIAVQ